MTTLWDTTGTEIVKALSAERRAGGAVASGLALTLVVVTDDAHVADASATAQVAAQQHPCRLLVVVRRQPEAPTPRLDAEVVVGGRLGPVQSVVMRMYGRLSLHAESVVLPLLAPDAPVVTWWAVPPPERIATDPLGVLAGRRVTDSTRCPDPAGVLRQRAEDYAAGDTDLAWTRLTGWRGVLASAFDDAARITVESASVSAPAGDPEATLLAGWITSRAGARVERPESRGAGVREVHVTGRPEGGGDPVEVRLTRLDDRTATLSRSGQPDRQAPLPLRDEGDLLAEELRRLDDDETYAEALGAAHGIEGLAGRPAVRTHEWLDPVAG